MPESLPEQAKMGLFAIDRQRWEPLIALVKYPISSNVTEISCNPFLQLTENPGLLQGRLCKPWQGSPKSGNFVPFNPPKSFIYRRVECY
jgi:hypothetical protein